MPSVELKCAFFALSAQYPLNRRTDDDSQHLRSKCQRYLPSSLAEIQGLLVRSGKACFLKYDVIHIILSVEQGVKDLPLLLPTPSKTPENSDENLGSRNYGARPVVIGIGGGFDDAMIEEMKSACKNIDDGVLWLRANINKIVSMPPLSDPDAYGVETVVRMKNKLKGLSSEEKKISSSEYFFT